MSEQRQEPTWTENRVAELLEELWHLLGGRITKEEIREAAKQCCQHRDYELHCPCWHDGYTTSSAEQGWHEDQAERAEKAESLLSESQAEVGRLTKELADMTAYASDPENPLFDDGWAAGYKRGKAVRKSSELAESQARERQLEADYRDLLCAHPERQHEALQAYLSSSVGGERTIDAAREVLSSETERK